MNKYITFFLLSMIPQIIFSQEKNNFGIHFSGFVKTDMMWDSRQTVDARDGHFLLYPQKVNLDDNGEDINARANFNILAIQSRLKGSISGPDAFGAKTSAVIEGAFFGNIGTDINGFRLRHAFAKLEWEHAELLVGQYWHPMFVTSCFPGVVSFNTGVPFQPFSRNPQVRYTQKLGDVKLIASALSQVDFKDSGPAGGSTKYLRNTGTPELNLRLEFAQSNPDSHQSFLIGLSGNFKQLLPYTEYNFLLEGTQKVTDKVQGLSAMAYAKYQTDAFTAKAEFVKGQLLESMTMLGGYAFLNTSTDNHLNYTPVNTTAMWADIHSNGKVWQGGLFAGYTKNDGTKDELQLGSNFYSRGSDIDYVYRLAPRIIRNSGKMRFATELEYTVAAYGETGTDGLVNNSKETGNLRLLLGLFYFF